MKQTLVAILISAGFALAGDCGDCSYGGGWLAEWEYSRSRTHQLIERDKETWARWKAESDARFAKWKAGQAAVLESLGRAK